MSSQSGNGGRVPDSGDGSWPAMHRPNYRDGSIVNLMQSVLAGLDACGAGTVHGHLADLAPEEIADARHVVLFVVDGLGCAQLDSGAAPALRAAQRGAITSVFPSTTATAVTTFLTGLAPVEHAVTGWFTWLAEYGTIVAPLLFRTREGDADLRTFGVAPTDVFTGPSVFERVRADCHAVQPAQLTDTPYSQAHMRGATPRGFDGLDQLVDAVADIVRNARQRSYISAYWPVFDSLSHEHGSASRQARGHLATIDACFERLCAALAGSGTMLVVTADHGFVDTRPESRLDADARPGFANLLARPLCGEPRAAYCYVRDAHRADFARRADEALGGAARVVESATMIADGWFGLADPHPRLAERVGDYTLVMRGDYTIRDRIAGEKRLNHVGVHGGASREEMYVPLVVVPAS